MDIQGAEYRALSGMQALLSQSPGVSLITEFWSFGLGKSGVDPRAYLRLLADLGFSFFEMDGVRRVIESADEHQLLKRYTVERENHADLLCKKEAGSHEAQRAAWGPINGGVDDSL